MNVAAHVSRSTTTIATSYSIVVPPGFVTVPGGRDAARSAAAVFAQLPDEVRGGDAEDDVAWRLRFGSAIEQAAAADVDGRVLDSYLSAGPLPGAGVVCSIVVASVPVGKSPHADLDRLLLARVASHGASPRTLAGDPAVVWDDPAAALVRPASGVDVHGLVLLRRRTVLARIAGRSDLVLTVVLTVGAAPEAEPDEGRDLVVEALAEVFDAVLSTFRWRDAEGRLVTDRPIS